MPADKIETVAVAAGADIVFCRFPADYVRDWHCAPRRQYLMILSGQMEFGIGDGERRRFGPGDVVLTDDRSGQGHTTASVGETRVSATIAIAD